ncbi:MAG TPA: cysteine--tRNA ligase [Kofleriaceae bacterium]|nr:cysteine--tRNA ligase [Kofleriaceae bacterium]
MSQPFRLYDSLRRQKVPFEPLVPGNVGVYVCGPTTYAPAHIGHAYSAIAFDTVRRSLEFLGWNVKYVRNVTDIDDKIIKRANETHEDPFKMSAHFAEEYNRDMARFNVRPPTVEPKVTGHIKEIIALVERLVANGHAYAVDGDVYYEVEKFPPYGKLSGQTLDQLKDGARIDVDERKKNPADFALWKSAKPGEPSWDSPWGKGRPGWHIECSAMTVTHLGPTFDIHAGGKDLIFPHHENEIAQSQGADGEGTFARYWLHNGFLNFEGVKMSKSLGNVFNCDQIALAVGGEALRYFCVKHHYRSPVDFDVQVTDAGVRFFSLESADRELAKFYEALHKIDQEVAQNDGGTGPVMPEAETLVPKAREALADDFNAPVVVASLHAALTLANKLLQSGKGMDKDMRQRTLARLGTDIRTVGAAIGVFTQAPATYLAERRARLVKVKGIDVAVVEAKIAERTAARAAKDFKRGDVIKDELVQMGVALQDLKGGGTDWSVQD